MNKSENHTKVFGDSTKYYSHEWPRQSSSKSPKLFLSFVSAPALFLCSLQNISALLNLIKQWDYSVAFSKHETWQKLNRVRDFWLWDINMNCLYKHCILEKKTIKTSKSTTIICKTFLHFSQIDMKFSYNKMQTLSI